jgi:exonuclease III
VSHTARTYLFATLLASSTLGPGCASPSSPESRASNKSVARAPAPGGTDRAVDPSRADGAQDTSTRTDTDLLFMAYNYPSGAPESLAAIAALMAEKGVKVAVFQELPDPSDAKNTLLRALQAHHADWQMVSTRYDDSKDTDSYVFYSRWPLRDLEWRNAYSERKAVTAITDTPAGPLRLYNVHTSTRDNSSHVCDTNAKYNQLQILINLIQEKSTDELPYVIGGDFNAILKEDNDFINCGDEKKWFRDHHVVSCIDVVQSEALCRKSTGSENGAIIDYILVPSSERIDMTDAWIHPTKFAAAAGEHHPVFAMLHLSVTP